jgi:hypothetical protein
MSVCKWYEACPIKLFIDEGMLDKKWAENYCLKGNKKCARYIKEEKHEYHPDNMLPDGTIDTTLNLKIINQFKEKR